jgi:hypothetical protein
MEDAASYGVGPPAIAIAAAALLADVRCSQVENNPDSDNEVVQWQDSLHRVAVQLDPQPSALAWEIARMVCVLKGAGIIERINTWARITAIDPGTGADIWTTELRAPSDSFVNFGGAGQQSSAPFPFPLEHPVTPGNFLTIRWSLRVQPVSSIDYQAIPFLAAASAEGIPLGDRYRHLPGDWDDMRYVWGSRFSEGHQFVFGGFSLVRLFATVNADSEHWRIQVAGRLVGFTQNSGHKGAVLANVTRR